MSPEATLPAGKSITLAWMLTFTGQCTQWNTTDDGDQGEEDVNCLYNGTASTGGDDG